MKLSIVHLLAIGLLSMPLARAAEGTDTTAGTKPSATASTKRGQKKKKSKKAKQAAQDAVKSAEENPDAAPVGINPPVGSSTPKVIEAPPSLKAANQAEEAEEIANARIRTEEGSKSPFSGQLNIVYAGSSLNHPFSEFAPNPGNQSAPPLVTLSGTVSARYRIDRHTTVGVGTGVTTETPFQGPKNTTASNPYIDFARSFKTGPIQHRADFQITGWTEDQMHNEFGGVMGFSILDEAYYEFAFGLTAGLAFEIDYNIFKGGPAYGSPAVRAHQVTWDIYPEPYFEYQLSKRVSLRSVIGIGWDHRRSLDGAFDLFGPKVYQTLGVGISAADWLYLYPYVKGYPYSGDFGVKTTILGLNAIVNLF